MNRIHRLMCLLLWFCSSLSGWAQSTPISGVINQYEAVVGIASGACRDTLQLANPLNLLPGDRVMVYQPQGGQVDLQNISSAYGNVTAFDDAGNYELATVQTVTGNQIELTTALLRNYNLNFPVQIISVPVYTNATVVDTLKALPWNGQIGGVLALEVSDTLTLQADLNVDGMGFRGGLNFFGSYPPNPLFCSVTDLFNPIGNFNGGQKGEGIQPMDPSQECGRGHFTNGGGGGNASNAGGAGGANAAFGGDGGNEWSGCGGSNVGGLGGQVMLYNNGVNKIFLGGGGGGGESNGLGGTDGENGGGIALVRANVLVGNGFAIRANGNEVRDTATFDGAGGGGAGGVVLLEVPTFQTALNVFADGGQGGHNNNGGSCVGTGGGGGAGLLWHSGPSLPGSVTVSLAAGPAGLFVNPAQTACFGTAYGATFGGTASALFGLIVPQANDSVSLVDTFSLGMDTALCQGDSLWLTVAVDTSYSILWSDSTTDDSLLVQQTGMYWVRIANACDTGFDTLQIRFDTLQNLDLGPDTAICFTGQYLIDPGLPFGQFQWSNGSTDSTFSIDSSQTVSLMYSYGCGVLTDTVALQLTPIPFSGLPGDTGLCAGDSLILRVPSDTSFQIVWSDSSQADSLIVSQTGTYWVRIANACDTLTDTIQVRPDTLSNFSLGNDTVLCPGGFILLTPNLPAGNFLWSDSSTGNSFVVTAGGTYGLQYSNACGSVSDTLAVQALPLPTINLPSDDSLCFGETLLIDHPNDPLVNYQWSFGGDTARALLNRDTTVWITASNACGQVSDTIRLGFFPEIPLDLGADTLICESFVLTLNALVPGGFNYRWFNGSTGFSVQVNGPGSYWASTDVGTCTVTDTIDISNDFDSCFRDIDCFIEVPNVFTPNNDGLNDVFQVNSDCNFTQFEMSIYNRWGNLVYRTFDFGIPWDGNDATGRDLPEGVYFYVFRYQDGVAVNADQSDRTGSVTLLR